MLYPIKVIDIELSQPIPTIEGLEGYMGLQGLVRLHGVPLGYVKAPISLGKCTAATLSKLILEEHSEAIIAQLLKNGLASPHRPADFKLEDLINLPPVEYAGEWPLVTVAVCTRDRPDDIKLCLEAISDLDYPNLEILVVDNAPATESTKDLVDQHYSQVRYVREPRPGLDWARNRAILEAKGEIIAFTDDDVVVDQGWVKAIAKVFTVAPDVMAITGLVVPYELETEAQAIFERNGGFGRGFKRRWAKLGSDRKMNGLLGVNQFGTGANMAYRLCVFREIGFFDPALDVGTVTNGGGDLEMFFRVLKEGHTLVYEPQAIVRHRHRKTYEELRIQLRNNGSIYSCLTACALKYSDEALSLIKMGLWWCWHWHLRNLLFSLPRTGRLLYTDLVFAEMQGSLIGLRSYFKACVVAKSIREEFGDLVQDISEASKKVHQNSVGSEEERLKKIGSIAVRSIELNQPLQPLSNVSEYAEVRIITTWKSLAIGHFHVCNNYQLITELQLQDEIVNHLKIRLLSINQHFSKETVKAKLIATLYRHYLLASEQELEPMELPINIPVSVVIATLDRPDDLRNCLYHLTHQKTERSVEIVVVDNNPFSGLTPPVIAEFPGIVLVNETRRGLAYARNTGFRSCTGDIAIATDDDVTPSPTWIETIVAPFARVDVMIVTGNTLPVELEAQSQRLFEEYGDGGLGRGYNRREVNSNWFNIWPWAVPTWLLGATANAAFRSSIFNHPDIGLMQDALGPGMPSGVGEDIYLFYKVLKAGYTILYEPSAFVWHRHRSTMDALRRQLLGYSKGIVSYHLTTLFLDHDLRALSAILVGIPQWHIKRFILWILKRTTYPVSLHLVEIKGYFIGPWALIQSFRRVRKEGQSEPYINPKHRNQKSAA